jgi:hypothetical protein
MTDPSCLIIYAADIIFTFIVFLHFFLAAGKAWNNIEKVEREQDHCCD